MRKISSAILGCLLLALSIIPISADASVGSAVSNPEKFDTLKFKEDPLVSDGYFKGKGLSFKQDSNFDQSSSYHSDLGEPGHNYWVSNDITYTVTNDTKYIMKNAKFGLAGADLYPGTEESLKWSTEKGYFVYTYQGRKGGSSFAEPKTNGLTLEVVPRGNNAELLDLYGHKYTPNDTINNFVIGELKPGESKTFNVKYKIGPDSKEQEGYWPKPLAYSLGATLPSTVAAGTPEVNQNEVTGNVKIKVPSKNGNYAEGTEIMLPAQPGPLVVDAEGFVTIPNELLRDTAVVGVVRVREKDRLPIDVDGEITIPARKVAVEKPDKIDIKREANGDAIVTITKADGSKYAKGTDVLLPGVKDFFTIGEDGTFKVANALLPEADVKGDVKIVENGKFPTSITGTTPARYKFTKEAGSVVVTQDPKTGDALVKPLDKDGKTYQEGTKMNIPGVKETLIIGKDGTASVVNAKLPKTALKGTVTLEEPGKLPFTGSEMVTPAQKLTTDRPVKIHVSQAANGDATVTLTKGDGSKYAKGTQVQLPGLQETFTIGEDGTFIVVNAKLPEKLIAGEVIVTEANKFPATITGKTPARYLFTKEIGSVVVTQDPKTGDAVVKPLDKDGKTYVEGTQLTIPGVQETLVLGKDGTVTVLNGKLPKIALPGIVNIMEPGKLPFTGSEMVTPAQIVEKEKPVAPPVTPPVKPTPPVEPVLPATGVASVLPMGLVAAATGSILLVGAKTLKRKNQED